MTETWRRRSRESGQPWVVDMDEQTTALTPTNAEQLRKQALYDVYFSGGNIEWYFGFLPLPPGGDVNLEDFRTRESMWGFMRHAREFMEAHLPFWQMQPDDTLVSGESQDFGGAEVFALPGQVYAIYLPSAASEANIDLSFESGVEYEQRWFNPETGEFEGDISILSSDAQQSLGNPPSRTSDDWVILVSRQASELAEVVAEPTVVADQLSVAEDQRQEEPAVLLDDANPINNLPAFISLPSDLQVTAGELLELRVEATDQNGPVPDISIVDAPVSSSFDDNLDGTRTFRWTPGNEDVGSRVLVFVTTDAQDATLRTEQSVAVTIESNPSAQSSTEQEVAPDSEQASVPEVTLSADGSTPADDSVFADASAETPADTSADTPADVPAAPATTAPVVQPPTAPTSTPATVTLALRPELESNLAPVLLVPDVPPIEAGSVVDLLFVPVDPEGLVPSLWMAGLPAGAVLIDNGNGTRSFQWTPTAQDIGSYQLPIFLGDAADPTLIRELELRLEVIASNDLSADEAIDESVGGVSANAGLSNQPPLFPALAAPSVPVGAQLSLNVQPIDPEGSAPVLQVQNAPAGASFDDNGVGGRVLLWTPGPEDIGEHFVRFIAIDAEDSNLSTDIVRKITVLAASGEAG